MADIRAVVGPMRCGKSEHQIALIKRMRLAGKKVMVLKPIVDTRTIDTIASRIWRDNESIVSSSETALVVNEEDRDKLFELINNELPDAIFADECQFFKPWFYDVVLWAAEDLDIPVFLSGLDLDAWKRPFGVMPSLLAIANRVEKLEAVCNKCKSFDGRFTQKLGGSSNQIEVGDEQYEPRCRKCHTMPIV